MSKNWYQQWMDYIENDLEAFIHHFFPTSNAIHTNKSIILNPSPCCGHNECFSFSKEQGKPFGYCFSCGTMGNRIQIAEQVLGFEEARDELEIWTSIKRNKEAPVMTEEDRHRQRINEIATFAVEVYHHYLVNTEEGEAALKRQLGANITEGERNHQLESLIERKIGLSLDDFSVLEKNLKEKGFTQEDIEIAKKTIWVPPGYYTYPYFDARGHVIRINTKPFRLVCLGARKDGAYDYSCGFVLNNPTKQAKKEHEESRGHVMSPTGYSTGEKDFALYFNPTIKQKKKYLILVEGENDEISFSEALAKEDTKFARDFLVVALGGNHKQGFFELPFFRNFEKIYEAFDPDEAGEKYRTELNEARPDVMLYHIPFDEAYGDIDAYLNAEWSGKRSIRELIADAELIESNGLLFECVQGQNHLWIAKNRLFEINFTIMRYNVNQSQFDGQLVILNEGDIVYKQTGLLDKISVGAIYHKAKLKLSNHLEKHYNSVDWEFGKPVRRLEELLDIIRFTRSFMSVCKQIAWYLHQANEEGNEYYQRLYQSVRSKVTEEKTIATILQEVNAYSNQDFDGSEIAPFIRLSQHFNVKNNDAFFYFSRNIKDGDEWKTVPCLLTNKQEEIRLDLIQRKDPQSMLLIKNRYQLSKEVKTAIMRPEETSLQAYWVDRWKNGQLTDEELSPLTLIRQIEEFISRVYYFPENRKRVLAIWIYATYYYMMFQSGFPYLLFNGEKGTGKSTLDIIVSLLALNPKIAVKISESALYRTIDHEGGTFILDETENLDNKKSVDQNLFATILKAGYSDTAYVYLSDPDQGNSTVKFSVFGPKVISNINGLDDVIADRCLIIRTYRVSEEYVKNLEKPEIYKLEKRSEVHEISSKCVISALRNFKEVHRIFHELASIQTGNLRLNQIIHPLMTIAKLVGCEYEDAIIEFYNNEVKGTKEDIAETSLEGLIKRILSSTAREFGNIVRDDEKWITNSNAAHLYSHPILYNQQTRDFDIDTLQIKLLCEEMNTELNLTLALVKKTLDNILGPKFQHKDAKPRRTTVSLQDENLMRLFDGKKSIRVYRYTLNFEDVLTSDELKLLGTDFSPNEGPTLF